jgi:tryptophan 2-monooxygenase
MRKYLSMLPFSLMVTLIFVVMITAGGVASPSPKIASNEPLVDSYKTPIVLSCSNLWDGQADKPLGPMEILVKDGKIVEMSTKVSKPDGAKVVQLTKHMVTPGFIDCHMHLTFNPYNSAVMITQSQSQALLSAFRPLRLVLMNGFTTVRDVASMPQWNFLTVDMKHAIDRGEIIGPRMIVAPHCITSLGGHGDFTGMLAPEIYESLHVYIVADGPDEIQKEVRDEIRGGADWIKFAGTGGFMSPTSDPGVATYTQEEINILVKTAQDQGIPVCVHAYGDEGAKRAIIAGVDSIEHANMASLDTLNMMESNGTYIVPTQYCFVEPLANLNNSTYWANKSPWLYKKYVKYGPAILQCQKNLANSNVKIAFGTDAGSLPFEDEPKEFSAMVKNGITPLRALKAATSTAAEMLRRPDLGVLAVGRTADIIAMPGDPFQDINVTGKVDFVMKDGKVYKQP